MVEGTAAKPPAGAHADYEDLYENAPDMYASVDSAGIVTRCNRTLLRVTGFRREEVVERSVLERYPTNIHAEAQNLSAIFQARGIVRNAELQLRVKGSGPPIPVLLSATAIRDAKGHIVSTRLVWRDIRDIRSAESSLRRHAAIVSQVSDAIIVTNETGVIETFNPAAERLYGWMAVEVLGLPMSEVLKATPVRPGDAPTRESVEIGGEWFGEAIHTCKDGTSIRVAQSTSMVRDDSGRPAGLVSCIRDVTAETQASEARRLVAAVVDATDDGIASVDAAGLVTSWSRGAERLFDRSEEEAVGRPFPSLFSSPAALAIGGALDIAQSGIRTTLEDARVVDRILSFRFSPLDFDRKRGVAIVARDVTERAEARKTLEATSAALEERTAALELVNEELRQFSYSVSHDLRAPLRAVQGYSTLALERYGEDLDPRGVLLLEKAVGGAQRMGELINGLLALARAGRDAIRRRPIEMGGLVREAFNLAATEGVGTRLTVEEPLPAAQGDYTLLATVWANLVGNAVKYSAQSEDPVVHVRGWSEDDMLRYEVRDSGAGFEEAYAGKLFQPFQRLHDITEFEGTGIGLAIVRKIVERHGGEVWARAPGAGATFGF